MTNSSDLLTAPEAAVVSNVTVREINRIIDERILPDEFFSVANGRHIRLAGCSLIAFYFGSAKQLTSEERLRAIGQMGPKLRRPMTAAALKEDWRLRDKFLTIDLAPFLLDTWKRRRRLEQARELVVSSPEVLGGAPVLRGTRIPVYDVAASVTNGISIDRILAAYPSLDADKVDLAATYAAANPPRGRPRQGRELPKGATIITDRSVPRRRKPV